MIILVYLGADPNRPSKNFTALHLAAMQTNYLLIHCLCLYGANPYLTDNHGRTPLDLTEPDSVAFNLIKFYQCKFLFDM